MSRLSRHEGRSPLPSLQSEISILNAEKYGEEPRRTRSANGKRSLSEDHDDDDDDGVQKKRSRGRPRLDTKDETAADRRRTQIRLAQRAYRHRKDTAITTLEQKVKDLEASNEAMSKEFTKFYDIILAEGIFDIAPHAAPRLRLIADRLLRLSSMVGTSSITSESDDSIMAKPAGARKSLSDVSMHHGHQTNGLGEPDLSSSAYPTVQHHPGSFNYEVIAQATPNNASFPFFASMESSASQPPSSSYLGTSLNNPSPYPRLSSPTYGFHERFSKRLQRTTLECGLRLATMKNPPPERYATVFGFSLLFESRDSIIRRLAAGLKKIQSEGVDWKFPTPSMQNDQFGYLENQFSSTSSEELNNALLSLSKSATSFANMPQFGAQPLANSEEKAEHRIRMLCQNFEGEFFTADEVELFLRRLGLAIPPNVDYVDSELDLNELQAADEASTKSHFASIGLSPGNSGIGGIQSNMWQMNNTSLGDFGSSLRGDSSEGQNTETTEFIDKTDLDGGLVTFMNNHDFSQIWPTGSSWSKTKVSVDVGRLIDELVNASVCLGRTPGIRPKDVIKAVKVAAGLSPTHAP
ncbi:uncharacterized protein TrAFT101_006641 [Trichoderma asperellum]|uniref:BZIP domain-containing protein n=1 Tax=Trichoderma asperellum (strain ATCC 204424 / CBS 433.97 / NBRC 101777) TaxID=1042311 RepID=A0A2T3Z1D5_TRIA4|nr:hypothetical protein M441DRAFT_70993 [Trichoderma asperellum CBS 433.97]PTB38625.1 hypothetical protein M441DRAFT_70993 [Trichoderma asperellum CBS 433.97]UKZ91670.1 hypothetical protein TrAFT101_006641 [Trichoderma asperellum]